MPVMTRNQTALQNLLNKYPVDEDPNHRSHRFRVYLKAMVQDNILWRPNAHKLLNNPKVEMQLVKNVNECITTKDRLLRIICQ